MNISWKEFVVLSFMVFVVGVMIGDLIRKNISVNETYGNDYVIIEKTIREDGTFSYRTKWNNKQYRLHTTDDLNIGDVISMRKN